MLDCNSYYIFLLYVAFKCDLCNLWARKWQYFAITPELSGYRINARSRVCA